MTSHTLTFRPSGQTCTAPTGTLIADAARLAGIEISRPCGGQGRCGRCAVIVESGQVRRRSTLRLSPADVAAGYALACQTVVEGDATILVPEQEKIERHLVTDKAARKVSLPFAYDPARDQTVRAFTVTLTPPSLADATDDVSRLEHALADEGLPGISLPLALQRELSTRLRAAEWQVTAVVETDNWRQPQGPARLIDLLPAGDG